MSNTEPSTITFSNNRVEGEGREEEGVPVEELVEEFLESEHSDPERGPVDLRLTAFLAEYETASGLKRFKPISEDEIDALVEEYERQRS